MLTASIKQAIKSIEKNLDDLAIDVTIQSSAASSPYTPGQSQLPSTTSYIIRGVVTSYKFHEIDNDRILSSDVQLLIFSMDIPLPKSNDYALFNAKKYRVVTSKPIFLGSAHVASTVQLRPYVD